MKKVSVIIPNYNNGRFIKECLESVAEQDYDKKEIIIVDDGSTDNSIEIINEFMEDNKKINCKLIRQVNFNAAMARNKGMEAASGDYAIFLDSDDLLHDNDALSNLISIYERDDVDLVIGEFSQINENGAYIQNALGGRGVEIVNLDTSFSKLVEMSPMPSNKLYSLELIRKKNLVWGNVRIGQDLNFYLKYLALCKRVAIVDYCVYDYRITKNSITRTYDFRIFDIINVFEDVEKFYNLNGLSLLYKQYIPAIALRHYNAQMGKQMFYKDLRTRKMIIDFFRINEKQLDYSLCKNCNYEFRKYHFRFRLKCALSFFFRSHLYCRYRLRKGNNERT